MNKHISKENIELASKLFAKCIEFSSDENMFSANLQFTSYVHWFEFDIYSCGGTSTTVSEQIRLGDDKYITERLNEMMEILIDEKEKSDIRNSPENIEATKEKQRIESIENIKRLEERLAKLKLNN